MKHLTYQEIMIEVEMGASYFQGGIDDAPLTYPEYVQLYDMIGRYVQTIKRHLFIDLLKQQSRKMVREGRIAGASRLFNISERIQYGFGS